MIDLTRFKAITFDCYGTLIDWESGLVGVLRSIGFMRRADESRVLESFARAEAKSQAGPYQSYKEVLRDVLQRLAMEFGVPTTRVNPYAISESIRDWPASPDTSAALRTLKRHYKLVVVSNIDRDLFEMSRPKLGVEFDTVITAQDVKSYKPAPAHFERGIETLGLPREQILHVAQSLYHDIKPARELGLASVWVDRRAGKDGGGATFPADAVPDLVVPDLATLASRVLRVFSTQG